jgi:EAL domain-containing protein (putative c-di-GMP-specific phosphodiesterase class I)
MDQKLSLAEITRSVSVVLTGYIADALAHAGVSASRLEIEVTENVFIGQNDAHWQTLEKLRKLGISIALDDFGTGWSSLGYIRRFNFNRLKIDKTFIQKCSSSREKTILEVIIDMGHRLGMALTAEGLEEADHVNLMRELGCQHGQGYLFARPMSSRDALTYAFRGQRPEQIQALIAG